MPKAHMKTSQNPDSPVRWFVWAKKWHPEYAVLFKLQMGVVSVWALDKQDNLYRSEDIDGWEDLIESNIPEFLEIDEEEAMRILIGGVNYAKPKYSNVNKAHGLSGVP